MKFKDLVENILAEDDIKGGLADNSDVFKVAKKHNIPVEDIKKQLEMGMKVEMEHTNDEKTAREIALDHLFEFPTYYTELDKMETKLKSHVKEMVAGGTASAFGPGVTSTASQFSSDSYAPGDARVPKIIGMKSLKKKGKKQTKIPIQRRNLSGM